MFSEIEAGRIAAGIEQKDLCARAGVHQTTYTARKSGRRSMSETTATKLRHALDSLVEERRAAIAKISGEARQC